MSLRVLNLKPMINKKIFLLLLGVFSSAVMNAQVVYFCNQPSMNGLPVDNATEFIFDANTAFLKVLLNNQKAFGVSHLIMNVFELQSDSFVSINENALAVNPNDIWTSTDYHFDHDGNYRFIFSDGKNELAKGDVKIDVNEDYYINSSDYWDSTSDSDYDYGYNDPTSTFYYIDSKVEFSLPGAFNSFESPTTTILISKGESTDVVCQVSNPKGLVTSKLLVDIYSGTKKDAYKHLIETKEIEVTDNPNSKTFTYSFSKKGDYMFSVYTADDIWINDGSVSIKYLH